MAEGGFTHKRTIRTPIQTLRDQLEEEREDFFLLCTETVDGMEAQEIQNLMHRLYSLKEQYKERAFELSFREKESGSMAEGSEIIDRYKQDYRRYQTQIKYCKDLRICAGDIVVVFHLPPLIRIYIFTIITTVRHFSAYISNVKIKVHYL